MSDVPHGNESADAVIVRRYIVLPRDRTGRPVLPAHPPLRSTRDTLEYDPAQMKALEDAVKALNVRTPVMVFIRNTGKALAMYVHPCRTEEEMTFVNDQFGVPHTVAMVKAVSMLDRTVFAAQMEVNLTWPRVWVHVNNLKPSTRPVGTLTRRLIRSRIRTTASGHLWRPSYPATNAVGCVCL